MLDQARTDKRREQKKGKRITVLCVVNQCFHLGSDKAGTSPHSACRKADPHTHFCCKPASSEPCLSSEDPSSHTHLQNSSSALLLVSSLLSLAQVYDDISTGGVFEEGGLDRSHIFLTIHDAVLFALASIREFVHPPTLEEVNLLPSPQDSPGLVSRLFQHNRRITNCSCT